MPEVPAPVEWRRSVFNGLAQIIVQASKEAGAIKLTARSAGLQPGTVLLQTKPASPRPAVP
jgi:beta-galactosidase